MSLTFSADGLTMYVTTQVPPLVLAYDATATPRFAFQGVIANWTANAPHGARIPMGIRYALDECLLSV